MKSGNPERIFVIIDGSNFYHRLIEPEVGLKNILGFDFSGFSLWLSREREIIQKIYCAGVVRAEYDNAKAQEMRKNQQKLFSRLEKDSWRVERGYIMKTDGFHEKGVDVKIAVDILSGAYENLYDSVILVSSDTDLIPAVRKVKLLGKRVEYIGFSHKPSFAMQKHCGFTKLLSCDDLVNFSKPQ